ncbi:MAG: nucleotidyltransferase domain-containing protein [Caldisericia bacterium]|nr:nucleotidyltransferase domain-containing protein [Caldisericia bacterium]
MEKKKIFTKLRGILLRKKEIEFAYIFGSFISNTPFEDIDIGIYLKKDLLDKINKLDYIIELGIILENKLKGFKIDLVILNDLEFTFLYHVFKEGKLLFSRNKEKYYDFLIYVIDNYLDYKEYRDYIIKEFLKG